MSCLHLADETIRRAGLIGNGDRVAVAISGGSDSVALARILVTLAPTRQWTVAGLVHLNHGLRAAAGDDEAFCHRLAASLGLPIEVGHVDVGAAARAARRSIEAAARDARYAFFDDARARLGATLVATGHTLDDQAETVLLRLLRGTGARGLAGIRLRRGAIIRPLLACRRAELRDWLTAEGQAFVEDETNQDVRIPRNRVRHELLPWLESYSPGAARALARCAALSADDESFLSEAATQVASTLVLPSERPGGPTRLDAPGLTKLPVALARRVVRDAAEQVRGGQASWSAEHVAAVLRLARADKPRGHLDLPGLAVERSGDVVLLGGGMGGGEGDPVPGFEAELAVPGRVNLPATGHVLEAVSADRIGTDRDGNAFRACLDAAALAVPLTVRYRRPGDRLRPLGAPGSRKLQDLFVDRKVPRSERARVPVVTDRTGRIVWVAGVTVAEECRVTAPEARVVILELRSKP